MAINVLQIVGGPADVTFNSVDVGGTIGGVLIKADTEEKKLFVDQSTMVLKKLAKKRESQVEMVLAQASSANLQMVLGSSTEGFGGNSANPEYSLTVAGSGPSSKTRTFTFHKASVVGSTEYKNEKGEEVGLKVTFDVIADLTKDADKQLFIWADA